MTVVPLYFAKLREVVLRGNMIIPLEQAGKLLPSETIQEMTCRMRSLGCTYCTGAMSSTADTVPKIVEELKRLTRSEREHRMIDHGQEASMELKKREGYF